MISSASKNSKLISKDTAVLIIIDMQERLVPVISGKEKVIHNIIRLARFAEIIEIPVICTEQQKLGLTLTEIRSALPVFAPIPKFEFNCFGASDFKQKIRALGRTTLIMTGIEAHICVAQTALYAVSNRYDVHVVGDAISSRTEDNRQVAVSRMSQSGITITSTEMLVYELLEKAGTDTFKEVLKLVK